MTDSGNCPSQQVIQELVNGTLSDAETDSLEQHLLECEPCSKSAETLFPLNEITAIFNRKEPARQSSEDEAAISRLITQAKELKPGSGQSSDQPTKTLVENEDIANEQTLIDSGNYTASRRGEFPFLLPAEEQDEIGRLGGYRVLDVLGSGGMGVVFRAEDPQLKRSVALKAMKPTIAANREAKARFIREAQATAAIEHDHIVQIYQVGEDQDVPFIAMQFLQGESLQQSIDREGKLDQTEVLRVGREIVSGLAAAHAQGLIHRDIKPDNIWLQEEQGRVRIVDFGLVRNSDDDVELTQTGVVMGTPRYMAPEQAQGEAVDHRCDLFSLGSVLYQLACGKPAFQGKNLTATLMAVAHKAPQPVQELNPDLDPALAALIMQLLEKDPDQRPQTALEVVEQIEQIETRQQVEGQPKAIPLGETVIFKQETADGQSGTGSSKRLRQVFGGLAVAILLGVLIFKFATRDGTVVVELEGDPEITSVEINNTQVSFSPDDANKRLTFQVDPGSHRLSITTADGLELLTSLGSELLEIKAGGHATLRAWVEKSTLTTGTASEATNVEWDLPPDAPAPAIAPFTAEQAKQHQEEWAKYLGMPVEKKIDLGDDVELRLILIPPGEFMMGTDVEQVLRLLEEAKQLGSGTEFRLEQEAPRHRVCLTRPYYIGKHEVTNEQIAIMNLRNGRRLAQEPAVSVTADQIPPMLARMNVKFGSEYLSFLLPSEAQWEFACRAGTETLWHFGDDASAAARYGSAGIQKVADLVPNGFGLYDMHGNAWEWCRDNYSYNYYDKSPLRDPVSQTVDNENQILRGGFWIAENRPCRSAFRHWWPADQKSHHVGFRLAASIKLPRSESWRDVGKTEELPTRHTWPADVPAPAIAPFTAEQAKQYQEEWADHLDVQMEREIDLGNGVNLTMVLIPPGEFQMGSTEGEQSKLLVEVAAAGDTPSVSKIPSEGPQHRVRITRPFYLGRFEVTQAQWQAVMGSNPAEYVSPQHPVETVSWNDVQNFLSKVNEGRSDELRVLLPTEAQWEYACRAGTTTPYYGGETQDDLSRYGWFIMNADGTPHPVGMLEGNAFGLFDMNGNVWEWCEDRFAHDFYTKSLIEDPQGPDVGTTRVNRGGSWRHWPWYCRSPYRGNHPPDFSFASIGFRVAATIEKLGSEPTATHRTKSSEAK